MDKEEKNIEEKNIEEKNDEEQELEEQNDEEQEEFVYTVDNNNINNDYNKNYEKKSYIYIFVGFILLVVIIITLIVLANKKDKNTPGYSEIETKLVIAAKKYYEKYPEQLPQTENPISISAEKLIENSYLKPFQEMTDENTKCTGQVKTYKHDEKFVHFPYLNCGNDYKTSKLNEKIIEENLVINENQIPKESGLYKVNNEYIFKGEYPNNYVKFNNDTWRIIKINEDGTIKLILTSKKAEKTIWDDRYNVEKSGYTGKNDFKISRILEKLKESYDNNEKISKENKELLVKRPWCIGSVSEEGIEIENLNLCEKTYDDLYIGLATIKEILDPSLDENCKNIYDATCTNYNYFNVLDIGWTINTGLNHSNIVFISNGGSISTKTASTTSYIRPVININADVIYKNGNGTIESPYIIEK